MMNTTNTMMQLSEIAERIRELREIMGWSAAEMADKTEVTPEAYALYESGSADIPFTFIHINELRGVFQSDKRMKCTM